MIWFALVLLFALPVHAQVDAHGLPAREQSSEEPAQEAYAEVPAELPTEEPSMEALSQSELDALGLDVEGTRVDTDFHFWGFADFTSSYLVNAKGAPAVAQGRYQSFYVGNLNLYVSKNLSESFRTMMEVRLTYLPNGSFSVQEGGYSVVDSSTIDYANGQSQTRWGGIILQRVYLEWTLHRLVAVRGGQFLTPLGIWNVDHGSPVYIPAQRPFAIVSGLFPERQTGLELFGRWNANNENTLGYHLTLSNGTGPISEYKDLDRNKAVGARAYWEYFGDAYFRLGASGYYGRDTVTTPTANITAETIDLTDKINLQSDYLVLAADLVVDFKGLKLQTEWITLQRRFTDQGRTVHAVYGGNVSNAASADTFSWVGYAMAAYRFGWYALTPYALIETGDFGLPNQSLPDARAKALGFRLGINVSPIDSVRFKVEVSPFRFTEAPAILRSNITALLVQIAWAF